MNRIDYSQQKIMIVGAGRTGIALCRYFVQHGAAVTLSDARPADNLAEGGELTQLGVSLDLGGHSSAKFLASDLIVISPGVSLQLPALQLAAAANIPILGEIEIACREFDLPLIAITGTNGKSTTTTLIGAIYTAWGKHPFVGGNLGTPLIEATQRRDYDVIVAEISSFQLEAVEQFHPRYALLLNLSEDHLDRYPDMASYIAAKREIFKRMTASDVAILNAEDAHTARFAETIVAQKIYFSSQRILAEGMSFNGTSILWRYQGGEHLFPVSELLIKGLHNIENVMAALIPPLCDGCPPDLAWQAACTFRGLEHRMNLVRVLDGVAWYNDSKGTNVGSVVKSLEGLTPPVTLIAGGKDKGGDYAPLAELVRSKVQHLILIGEASDRITATLGSLTHTLRAPSLEAGVALAHQLTQAGGTVLLSPGCSSFDMFKSYAERGNVFSAAVNKLPGASDE
ncbi:MAG: UDP-N-acetylmuramoyl-L-alanine--D-glutamate ligase [Desulfuromonadales bacterium]|nr:UDP-N-acetylmuramoyl-L-alanine--D-glutamate ligase [Desulfuromonadales bacterium]